MCVHVSVAIGKNLGIPPTLTARKNNKLLEISLLPRVLLAKKKFRGPKRWDSREGSCLALSRLEFNLRHSIWSLSTARNDHWM